MIKILMVEDTEDYRVLMRSYLEEQLFMVDEALDLRTAADKLQTENYDAILLDVILPDGNSIELFDRFPEKLNGKTIVVTAKPSIPDVVEAIQKGAFNYLEKPVEEGLLIAQVKKILELNRVRGENVSIKNEVTSNFTFDSIVYVSKKMEEVIERAKILSQTNNTILIQGETGVGKEVLSYSIHNYSNRKDEIFLPLNCASIPSELFESELFGFEKGAFTGAVDSYSGRFIQADKGTLFLDEIGELPLHIQAKLLRILDERSIYRLKSQKSVNIDVRLVAATNRDLLQEVNAKQFRSDLYYRLKESSIDIPPLRERIEDILPMAFHFIDVYNKIYDKHVTRIAKGAQDYLLSYTWRGNVRELKNTIKSIIPFKTTDTINLEDLSYSIIEGKDFKFRKIPTIEQLENDHILSVLKITGFHITNTAQILGVSRPRLYRKIKALELEDVVARTNQT